MVWFLLACAGGKGDSAPVTEPTFTNVQADIFTASCAFSTCHASTSKLNLEEGAAYDALVEVDSFDNPGNIFVVPGDSANSYLYKKCVPTDDILGGAMPDGNPEGLDDERLALLAAWIDAGAADD